MTMLCLLRNFKLNTIINRRDLLKIFTKFDKHIKRNLNVHEYVSYTFLKKAGIPVPNFGVANNKEEARKIAEMLNSKDMVIKAQVLAGGRGKGKFKAGFQGGVRMCYNPDQVEKYAARMLGDYLVTKQTGPEGRICNKVMVTERKYPRREFYIAVMLERHFGGPVIIASSQGGVNIEEVAAANPDAISYHPIDIRKGLSKELAEHIAMTLGLNDVKDEISQMLLNLYKCFIKYDAQLVELNPFAEDSTGKYFALDAKLKFDDNAEFRQQEVFSFRDPTQENPKEVLAKQFGLNYIALEGTIGCLVNGAGLAMATLDVISNYEGSPANFLDVGGGATHQAVREAFKIILSDQNVCCILVNIFGGIMRCDIIALGIIEAAKTLNVRVPIVCRLLGNNMEDAKFLINDSGMKIIPCDDLDEAARLSVKLSTIVHIARQTHLEILFEIPPQ